MEQRGDLSSYQVDVVGAQLLQTGIYGQPHALRVVADKIGLDLGLHMTSEAGGILGCEDNLVPHATLFHPFTDPGFRVFILVVVGTANVSRGALRANGVARLTYR